MRVFAKEYNIIFNVKKSCSMVFHGILKPVVDPPNVLLNGNPLTYSEKCATLATFYDPTVPIRTT